MKRLNAELPPTTLYHYTDLSGFCGIVGSQSIYASHTQYLNDQREYTHAIGLVVQEIDALMPASSTEDRDLLTAMKGAVQGGIEQMPVCVCSFSEAADSLSQWRAYGGHAGMALGFASSKLSKWSSSEQVRLAKCIYNQAEQREAVRELVAFVLNENRLGIPWEDRDVRLPEGGFLVAYLHSLAPMMKDSAFSDEKEWRLISRPRNLRRCSFRVGPSMLIPYIQVPLRNEEEPFALDEIVVGPCPNGKLALASAIGLLINQGHRNTHARASTVPYRAW